MNSPQSNVAGRVPGKLQLWAGPSSKHRDSGLLPCSPGSVGSLGQAFPKAKGCSQVPRKRPCLSVVCPSTPQATRALGKCSFLWMPLSRHEPYGQQYPGQGPPSGQPPYGGHQPGLYPPQQVSEWRLSAPGGTGGWGLACFRDIPACCLWSQGLESRSKRSFSAGNTARQVCCRARPLLTRILWKPAQMCGRGGAEALR